MRVRKNTDLYKQLVELFPNSHKNGRYIHRYLNLKQIDWRLFENFSGDVLDVGCGIPIDAIVLSKMRGIRSISIVDTKQLSTSNIPKTTLFLSDAKALPFRDSKFDVTMSFSAIEHLPDREGQKKWIAEMVRVTKPGGKILITVDNSWSLLNRIFDRYTWGSTILCINPSQLKQWVYNNGKFKVEKSTSGLLYYYGNGPAFWRFSYPAYVFDRFVNIFDCILPYLCDRIGFRFKKL